ncbi:MAG: aldose epimerase [Prochlorotrichaceae cyanobacterium]
MAKVSVEQQQYKTYLLEDETSGSRVAVIPERGGIALTWALGDLDVFYLDRDRFKDPALSIRGGVPILFPICGNLPEDAYEVGGQAYKLAQHGFARNVPWTVVDQQEGDAAALSIELTSNESTLSSYPFEFSVRYTYIVQGNSLEIRQVYENKSSQAMPCSFGFHPYFEVTDKSQLSFEIPATQWQDKATGESRSFSGNFDFNEDELDMALYPISGQVATVTDGARSCKLILEYDRCFSTLVFWTVKGKDFYCLEPWSAPRNALNTGTELTTIAPGQSLETWIKMTVER